MLTAQHLDQELRQHRSIDLIICLTIGLAFGAICMYMWQQDRQAIRFELAPQALPALQETTVDTVEQLLHEQNI